MSSLSLAADVHPVSAHTSRMVVRATASVALFAALCGGVYQGARAFTAHYDEPTSTVSYASPYTIARTLAGAWHTPATAGDFRPTASIQTADVVSVVKVAN